MKTNTGRRKRVMMWLGVACLGPVPPGPASAQEPKQRDTLKGHMGMVYSLAYSPDGKLLASGSDDETVKLWDVQTGKERATLPIKLLDEKGNEKFIGPVSSLKFSPDSKTVCASVDQTIKQWDVQTGKERATLKTNTEQEWDVAYSPDGKTLASGSTPLTSGISRRDNTITLWDVQTGKERATLKGHKDRVVSVAYSPDGKTLATGSLDMTIKVWSVVTGNEQATLKGHTHLVYCVAYSPDGKTLASASVDKTVKLWDVQTGKERATLKGHAGFVDSVVYSPDGMTLASTCWDTTIKLWDVKTGKERATLKGDTSSVYSVAFSPDSKTLASWGKKSQHEGKTIKLWDVQTGKERATLQHTDTVYSVAFSPDGKTLASGSGDKTIKLWDIPAAKKDDKLGVVGPGLPPPSPQSALEPKLRDILKGHTSLVTSVAYSPDGKTLASASNDETIRLWDVKTGGEGPTLIGHENWV
jgi:WD40 repeat protein